MKGFYKHVFMICTVISCLFFLISPVQSYYGGPSPYSYYQSPINININLDGGGYPYDNQPYYAGPYAGYGYNRSYNYGGYPYQSSGYAPSYYSCGQPNYGSYYPGYSYSQPPYYGYSQPSPYGYSQPSPYGYSQPPYYGYSQYPQPPSPGYPYRGSSYYQPYPGPMQSGGYYPGYSSYIPGYSSGWDIPNLPNMYSDADLKLDDGDDGDDYTVEAGDMIAVILPGTGWALDTDEFDDDILRDYPMEDVFGFEWFKFKAEEAGTTTIKIDCGSFLNTASCGSTFEVEITVED